MYLHFKHVNEFSCSVYSFHWSALLGISLALWWCVKICHQALIRLIWYFYQIWLYYRYQLSWGCSNIQFQKHFLNIIEISLIVLHPFFVEYSFESNFTFVLHKEHKVNTNQMKRGSSYEYNKNTDSQRSFGQMWMDSLSFIIATLTHPKCWF